MKTYRIYKIENTINDLLYVGFTTLTLERRMKQHVQSSQSAFPRHMKNPLYIVMREMGVSNFHIRLLEEGEYNGDKELSLIYGRECLWMHQLNTIHPHGYNRPNGRITDTDAAIIRFNAYGLTRGQYAKLYDVHPSTIDTIRFGASGLLYTYRHVTKDYLPPDINAYAMEMGHMIASHNRKKVKLETNKTAE